MAVTVYVLRSEHGGKRYVGITNNLPKRLREHAARRTKGGQILEGFALLHTEEFPDHASARAREVFLKSSTGRRWLDEFEARTTDRAARR